MQKTISALLIVVALIHLLPAIGILGSERLTALYAVTIKESDLLILMRHRAVLFGLLGVFLFWSSFQTALQPFAFAAAGISLLSFILLAWSANGVNSAIQKVIYVDMGALACLLTAVILYVLQLRQN